MLSEHSRRKVSGDDMGCGKIGAFFCRVLTRISNLLMSHWPFLCIIMCLSSLLITVQIDNGGSAEKTYQQFVRNLLHKVFVDHLKKKYKLERVLYSN